MLYWASNILQKKSIFKHVILSKFHYINNNENM